jgi:hypothetical protein
MWHVFIYPIESVSVILTSNTFWAYRFTLKINPSSPVVIIGTIYFNILKCCILPTECIFVSRVVLIIKSACCTKQH